VRLKTRFIQFVSAAWLTVGFTHPVWSQSSVYFNRASFVRAAQALPGTFQNISWFPSIDGPVYTIADVTFRGTYLLGGPNGVLYNFDGSNPGLSIHFATGARAFGADFSSVLSPLRLSSFTATVSLDTGESFQFTAPTDPNFRFFGFISPTPIIDMTFSDGGLLGSGHLHEELLGNIAMVTVPEASSLAFLVWSGFLVTATLVHRRFRHAV
jgi:hypothetical protein